MSAAIFITTKSRTKLDKASGRPALLGGSLTSYKSSQPAVSLPNSPLHLSSETHVWLSPSGSISPPELTSSMELSPYPSAVELDAGDAPLVLPLASVETPFAVPPEPREIFVRRARSDRRRVLVVLERSTSDSNGTIRESRQYLYLDPLQDFVIPIYANPTLHKTAWNVEVGYCKGAIRVDYPFKEREDAFRFQQLVTGYKPVEVFHDVAIQVTYMGCKLPLPRYVGFGQIQLWRDMDQKPDATSNDLLPVSSRSSQSSQSADSIRRKPTFVQTYGEKSVLVFQNPRPPLLVAFLKDEDNDEGYTMLKINSTLASQTRPAQARRKSRVLTSSL